jgi:hypothetical protein
VVIDNLNIHRTRRAVRPFEAYAPPVVDADAVLTFSVAPEGLEPVSGQDGKVAECVGRFEPVQLQASGAFDAREGFDAFSSRESRGFLRPETNDHQHNLANETKDVKRNDKEPLWTYWSGPPALRATWVESLRVVFLAAKGIHLRVSWGRGNPRFPVFPLGIVPIVEQARDVNLLSRPRRSPSIEHFEP